MLLRCTPELARASANAASIPQPAETVQMRWADSNVEEREIERPGKCQKRWSNCSAPTFYYLGRRKAGTRLWGQQDPALALASSQRDKISRPSQIPDRYRLRPWLTLLQRGPRFTLPHSTKGLAVREVDAMLRGVSLASADCVFQSCCTPSCHVSTAVLLPKISWTLCVCSWRAA